MNTNTASTHRLYGLPGPAAARAAFAANEWAVVPANRGSPPSRQATPGRPQAGNPGKGARNEVPA